MALYYNRTGMTFVWGLLAAVALLWPDRISGPFDGIPLDRTAEAVLIGAVFPTLLWLHRRFLDTRLARALVLALCVWKATSAAAFVQDGWCVRFTPGRPYVKDATGAPHAWDLRADWRSPDPACSAIMTRSYQDLDHFPAWFFNLPPDNDSWPAEADRPPGATTGLTVTGFVHDGAPGVLQIETGTDMATVHVDGVPVSGETHLDPGLHRVQLTATLTGDRWRLVPRWNGAEVWNGTQTLSALTATARRPGRLDLIARPWARVVPTALVMMFLLAWILSAIRRVGNRAVIAWSVGASFVLAVLVAIDRMDLARWAIAGLAGAIFVPVPSRLKNIFGAFVMIGIPWLTWVVVASSPAIGRFVLYGSGHDYWMFQRFAYRIVMQGYWLEGGSATFWFQPLYRWVAGLLHVVFGDSSVGEWYWDGACLLAGALFSFRVVKAFAGFRWGLVAAVTPLAVFVLGTAQDLIGAGLGETTSAGLLSLAALFAMRSRHGLVRTSLVAGALAVLAFYTRLNNLIMALGVSAFALPLALPARALWRPRRWTPVTSWRLVAFVVAAVGLGTQLFAWRTWHYTGVFSVFYGTQADLLRVWQPGMGFGTVLDRMAGSVLMVLTVNDPARFDRLALPVLAGAAAAVAALAGAPRLRTLPLAPVLWFFAAIAGAFVARGSAYPGRFSVHVLPVASALAICAIAAIVRPAHPPARW
jgi:hypothetical protein